MKAPSLNGTRTPPSVDDASRKLPTSKSTVNDNPTRSTTAPTDKTLGPRTA